MTTGVLATPPVLQFTLNNGALAIGGSILTQVGGVNAATYQDSGLTTPLPNPIPLNSRGEISDVNGSSRQLFLTPNQVYTFTAYDGPNGTGNIFQTAPYVNGVQVSITQAVIGAALYPQVTAETGITIVQGWYPPGVVDRYGTNTTPGTTDMTTAIQNAVLVNAAGGPPVTFLEALYLVTNTAIAIGNSQPRITIQGVPLGTRILNKAGASKPTIKLSGAQYFDIGGLVLIGATGFTNDGIQLVKDGSANRCAFGTLRKIVCQTNGYGIEIQDTNTVVIDDYSYWPSGGGSFGGTIDVNGQPGGIYASGTGAVNGVMLRNINIGGINSIANGGAGIRIDGGASAPFQAWEIDGLECEIVGCRALWARNVNIGSFKNLFVENAEVRIDQNCVRLTFEEIEGAATATVVVDGTQALGPNRQLTFVTCQAQSFTADATNSETFHVGCSYSGAGGFADSSKNARWINTETTGSALLPDQLNAFYRFKGAALTRTVTALADDSDLIVTALPKGTYLFRGYLQIQGITTGTQGFQFALRIGGGQTGTTWIVPFGIINAALSNPNNVANVATPIGYGTISTAANTDELTFEGIVSTNGTGDIAVQWVENSASANGTKLNAGSWFKVEKIA